MTQITLNKGGTAERVTEAEALQIPDLWHIADHLRAEHRNEAAEAVLQCWHLAHDLKRHIIEEG